MGKKYDFDYIIIGSGPAGYSAAVKLAANKKHVAVIEGDHFGGANANTRDIPYLVNLNFAHTYYNFKNLPAVSSQDFHFNFPTIVAHQESISAKINEKNLKDLEDLGVEFISGYAHFIDNHTVAVGSTKYTAANFIIATGSHLKTSEISGLDSVNYLTPDTAVKIKRLPKFVFVIGGGSTGCEIAEYFAKLGTKVLIMERGNRLLPHEDKEVSTEITDYFEKELGIMVIPSTKVVAIEQDDVSKRVIFTSNAEEKMVRVDCIVLATGSEPSLDIGLENAGVKYKRSGIVVNNFFRTTAKNIYAVGDCINSSDSSTERSLYEGDLLAANLIKRSKIPPIYNGFIRKVNTSPEVAVIGMNESDILSHDLKSKKSIVYLQDLPASKIYNSEYGFIKIITEPNGKILGASIFAQNASLIAEEFSLAVRQHLNVSDLAKTPHLANHFNYAALLAAKKLAK